MKHIKQLLSSKIKISILILLIFSIGISVYALNQNDQIISDKQINYVDGNVIIKFIKNTDQQVINNIKQDLGASTLKEFKLINAELWQIPNGTVEQAIEKYKNNSHVKYIEPNYLCFQESITPNDTYFDNQWALHNYGQTGGVSDADIDAIEAWDIRHSSTVVVAVIDTGVEYTHPDLDDNMWVNSDEIPGDDIDNDGNGYIDDYYGYDFYYEDSDPIDIDGHGTHVAGIIGAEGNNSTGVSGIAWSTQIMALKVLSDTGGGDSDVANRMAATEYAVLNGASIINGSWRTADYSAGLYDEIDAARSANVLFVCSAGNGDEDYIGLDNDSVEHYPSNYDLDNIIAVAATTDDDILGSYSNYGLTTVDLAAPGSSIYSTIPGSSYDYKNGTSMASPHVAGAASLAWSYYPSYTYSQIRDLIYSSVDPLDSLDGVVATGGRLNINNMLPCQPPASGDWTVSSDCTLSASYSAPANVYVEDGVTLTIQSGANLSMDLSSYHINIGTGSRLMIEAGGKLD